MALTASPTMKGRSTMKSPHREMITVVPAKSTARPEVARETMTARRGSRPWARPCR